jgi:hypothetical protein
MILRRGIRALRATQHLAVAATALLISGRKRLRCSAVVLVVLRLLPCARKKRTEQRFQDSE